MDEIFQIIAYALAAICFILGILRILHTYWALNGQWGRIAVIPTKEDGGAIFEIGPISCMVVTIILLSLSYFYIRYFNTFLLVADEYEGSGLYGYGLLAIAGGVFLRTIGDFKYVGFFKYVRNTTFGGLDTKYFSPLCGLLGLGSLALYLLT